MLAVLYKVTTSFRVFSISSIYLLKNLPPIYVIPRNNRNLQHSGPHEVQVIQLLSQSCFSLSSFIFTTHILFKCTHALPNKSALESLFFLLLISQSIFTFWIVNWVAPKTISIHYVSYLRPFIFFFVIANLRYC